MALDVGFNVYKGAIKRYLLTLIRAYDIITLTHKGRQYD